MLSPAGDPAVRRPVVGGLLKEPEDHNCWAIAEAAGYRGPHRLSHLLSRAIWTTSTLRIPRRRDRPALYLPEGCAADEEHRELAGVPEQELFATKRQLAAALLERLHSCGSAPRSWPATKCTAAVSCAAVSASAGWAMWLFASTTPRPQARAAP